MLKRILVTGGVAVSLLTLALHAQPAATQPATAAAATQPAGKETTTASGLKIIEVSPGDAAAKAGDIVWVHYTGTLKDGTKFDSSAGREPIRFRLGKKEVIKGWDEGVAGMKIGEKRKLVIPSELGYGAAGSPPSIPGGAELHFDVELIGVARVAD